MTLVMISLAALALAVLGGWWWHRQPPQRAVPPAAVRRAAQPAGAVGGMVRPPAAAAAAPVQHEATPGADAPGAALTALAWVPHEALDEAPRQALVAAVQRLPRPPAALQQVLSPRFLDSASSQALAELITAEPQIAARVLASVNAPYHGLRQPVGSIGQAVTFLGLNAVRSLCLQYLLDDAFHSADPAVRRACAEVWDASALASDLCGRLAPRLGLADTGSLVTQVLLSFVGHLAAAHLLAQQPGGAPATGTLLARTGQSQARLGLGPAEIGALLLQAWDLPAGIVEAVRAVDRLLVTPAGALPADAARRLAVAHVCARLGEQLAAGARITDGGLAALANGLAQADEGFHLRAHLADPALARLGEHLQAPDLTGALLALQQGLRAAR